MSARRQSAGAAAPLFDRLVDRGIDAPAVEAQAEVLDQPALLASIAREIEDLFNSRACLAIEATGHRLRSAVDYGVRELSVFACAGDGKVEMERRLTEAVAAYEPRLVDPRVTIEGDPARRDGAIARIEGRLALQQVLKPVVFHIPLAGSGHAG